MGIALVVVGAVVFVQRFVSPSWEAPPVELIVVTIGLLLSCLPFLWRSAKGALLKWSRRREVTTFDVVSLLIGLLAVSAAWMDWSEPAWAPFMWAVAAALVTLVLTRAVLSSRVNPAHPSPNRSGHLYQFVLGDHGLDALPDLQSDKLGRTPIVDSLEALITQRRAHALTFGLEGAWGSGKTSILNELAKRLKASGVLVIRFDAWSFREPDSLVEAYYRHLSDGLRDWTFLPGLRGTFRRLAQGLTAGSDSAARVYAAVLPVGRTTAISEVRQDLSEALDFIDRPVVVLIDDLDRLDEPELTAAFRAIRLVADLKISHVLAYGRAELSRILFPDDPTGTRSRDYLAKIVNTEVSIPPPSRERQLELLQESLNGLLEAVGPAEAERLGEQLRDLSLVMVCRALPTPREIKRVAAATAWMWEHLKPTVNVFDLFALNILQYRHPIVFDQIRSRPEWFVYSRNGQIDLGGLRQKDYEGQVEAWVTEYRKHPDAELGLKLLAAIFPSNKALREHPVQFDDIQARRERRIAHPQVFQRYFQLALGADEVSENVIEAAAQQILSAPEGKERQEVLKRIIALQAGEGGLRAFVDLWSIAAMELRDHESAALIEDLVLGFAESMHLMPGTAAEVLSPNRAMTLYVMDLLGRTESDDECTRVALEAARRTIDFGFLGTLVFYSADVDASRRARAFGNGRTPEGTDLRAILDKRLVAKYGDGPGPLFAEGEDELVAAVYRVTPHLIDERFMDDAKRDPSRIVRLLNLAVKVIPGIGPNGAPEVIQQDLHILAEHVDLMGLHRHTKNVPLQSWQVPTERAVVEVFRSWIETRERNGPVTPTSDEDPG